jgi:protein ImuB
MAFASVFIPDFMIQAVVRAESDLHNQAVALLSGTPPLWNVVAANPQALRAGIKLGMTKSQVTEFCNVQVRHRSESLEKSAHAALLDIGWSISPRVEDTSADTIVLDLDGLQTLLGSEENIAKELVRRISNIGLTPRIAIAAIIEAAVHAARGCPGITLIPDGEESAHLSRLPVEVLSASTEALETLRRWGVHTFAELATLPVLPLSERLGQEGVRLHELARGSFTRALVPATPGSAFIEEIELEDSVEELEPLSFLLGRLLDQLCARLKARALAIRAVHVQFELEVPFEKSIRSVENNREKYAAKKYSKVLTLAVPLRDSKTLLKLLRLQLQSDPPQAPIRKIHLAADPATPRTTQKGLFLPQAPDPEKLELTIARLAKLVGESRVGSPQLLDTYRPDGFHMQRFALATGEWATNTSPAKRNETESGVTESQLAAKPLLGFRLIRPPTPIVVDLQNSCPVRLRFRDKQCRVIGISGPWSSSGEWWQETVWHHDEWDLAVQFHSNKKRNDSVDSSSEPQDAIYRIYYDALQQSWFLHGIYD